MTARKIFLGGMTAAGLIGFLDATYLAAQHYLGTFPECSIISGCEEVLASPYAVIGGIPLALIGAVFYLAVFLLTVLHWDTGRYLFLKAAILLASGGFLVSLFLTYLQLVVLQALCLYCLVSAAASTLLFGFGILSWNRRP